LQTLAQETAEAEYHTNAQHERKQMLTAKWKAERKRLGQLNDDKLEEVVYALVTKGDKGDGKVAAAAQKATRRRTRRVSSTCKCKSIDVLCDAFFVSK
jgi:hypothetical protein